MIVNRNSLGTGLPELDNILKGLLPGDNIVWHTDSIDNYMTFARHFYKHGIKRGQRIIYFRFGSHPPVVEKSEEVQVYSIDPLLGFEKFVYTIHDVIEKNGLGGYYVFDCLSDLATEYYSDQMLSNFFLLTCPFLLDVEALAYFALIKNCHSSIATSTIYETCQVFIDVYNHRNRIYIHPIKVQQRYSSTMHMLHEWDGDRFVPVTRSSVNSEILSAVSFSEKLSADRKVDIWLKTIFDAEEKLERLESGCAGKESESEIQNRLLKMAFAREEKILELARKYMKLSDTINVLKRIIGTGFIGGKSVGMLLARAILAARDKKWNDILEVHDSFYIGSDVFYTFMVRNGCWWIREQQKDIEIFLKNARFARRLILTGHFPDYIIYKFREMLDYFGQSPIIVRSSSLLEDNFGNSFSGKYESVFCPNQGSRERCLEDFLTAIRTIYASTLSEKALRYRNEFAILDKDEQMSLLVQRVSGDLHANMFYPLAAGVAYSFNPYVWNSNINPESGVLRLVFGLGTRAVNSPDEDYTRIVALNDPELRPESNREMMRRYSQKRVDVIDLEANQLVPVDLAEVVKRVPVSAFEAVATQDSELASKLGTGDPGLSWSITFERLFKDTDFIPNMRELLAIVQEAYDYPVDIEFTANLAGDGKCKINIVQCRPFQGKTHLDIEAFKNHIEEKDLIFKTKGPVIGQSREVVIDRMIFVNPAKYYDLPLSDKYTVARLIGKIIALCESRSDARLLLIGPGRWGTSTPSLGVPVSFAEISKISVLCEIMEMGADIIPDVSLGTHFFNDLVDLDILYFALNPRSGDTVLKRDFFEKIDNKLKCTVPGFDAFSEVIKIVERNSMEDSDVIKLHANSFNQQVMCYKGKA